MLDNKSDMHYRMYKSHVQEKSEYFKEINEREDTKVDEIKKKLEEDHES